MEESILTVGHLLLRLLDNEECTLKDGQAEYKCINGNICLAVLKNMNQMDVQFVCDICKVPLS